MQIPVHQKLINGSSDGNVSENSSTFVECAGTFGEQGEFTNLGAVRIPPCADEASAGNQTVHRPADTP